MRLARLVGWLSYRTPLACLGALLLWGGGVSATAAAAPPPAPLQETTPLAPEEEAFLARVAELAKELPLRPSERGSGVIRGRVVTQAGMPLSGARIRATRHFDWNSRPTPTPFALVDLEPMTPTELRAASLVASMRSALATADRRSEASSTADGTFALTELPDGTYQLNASAAGHALFPIRNVTRYWIDAAPGDVVDYLAIPIIEMLLDVRLPDGGVPARAQVEFARRLRGEMPFRQAWSPSTPAITLPIGDWEMTVAVYGSDRSSSDDDKDWSSPPRSIVVPSVAPSAPLRIDLEGRPVVEGRILGAVVEAGASLQVNAQKLADDEDPTAAATAGQRKPPRPSPPSREASARVHRSDANTARYRVAVREPGRYRLTITRSDSREAIASALVEVGEAPVVHDFEFVLPSAVAPLLVTVRDPDGALLPWCQFEMADLTIESGGGRTPQRRQREAARQLDGRFALDRSVLAVRNALIAMHPRYGEVRTEVARDADSIELRFAPPAQLAVDLVGLPEPFGERDFELTLEPLADGPVAPRGHRFTATDAPPSHHYDLGVAQPGRWRWRLTIDSDRSDSNSGRVVAAGEWSFEAGEQKLTVTCPPLTTFAVAFDDAAEGDRDAARDAGRDRDAERYGRLFPQDGSPEPSSFGMSASGNSVREASTSSEGLLTFRDVPPGRWRLELRDGRCMELVLPLAADARPLSFVAIAVTALRVRIDAADGPLAKAGLANGDLVVALDGREWSDRESLVGLRSRLQNDRKMEQLTLTVRRGRDAWFETVIVKAHLFDAKVAGGRFEEVALPD